MRVVVTGATGFVGRVVIARLLAAGHQVVAPSRDPRRLTAQPGLAVVPGPDLDGGDWSQVVAGADAVVHLAARVHVMDAAGAADEAAFQRVNTEGTRALAAAARAAGVTRFVYMSSIKVNGEATHGRPFRPDDRPAPEDAYGRSKRDAEQALRALAEPGRFAVTVIRPPLVYGPGVGGNLLRLARLVRRGVPLPLGAVQNRRSLVSVGNLADLVVQVLAGAPLDATLLAADAEAWSTPDLVRALGVACGRPARLVPVPVTLLRGLGWLTGRGAEVARLTGSLEVDGSAARATGWQPRERLPDVLPALLGG